MWALAGTALRRKLLDSSGQQGVPSSLPLHRGDAPKPESCSAPSRQSSQSTAPQNVVALFNITWRPSASSRPPARPTQDAHANYNTTARDCAGSAAHDGVGADSTPAPASA
eukprot:6180952-Pleurochrysis_carterae.AAC.1